MIRIFLYAYDTLPTRAHSPVINLARNVVFSSLAEFLFFFHVRISKEKKIIFFAGLISSSSFTYKCIRQNYKLQYRVPSCRKARLLRIMTNTLIIIRSSLFESRGRRAYTYLYDIHIIWRIGLVKCFRIARPDDLSPRPANYAYRIHSSLAFE